MKTLLNNFKSSAKTLASVQVIALCGILLALRVVLGFLEINIGDSYRISFSALPVSLGAYMFGPIPGAILGALGDIVTLIVKPTGALNFGILFAKSLSGFLMGAILYKHPVSLPRNIIANVIVVIICNLIITTASISIVYGNAVMAILPARIVTNLIVLPFNVALLFGAQKAVTQLKPLKKFSI